MPDRKPRLTHPTDRGWQEDCEEHIRKVLDAMRDHGVHLNPDDLRHLMVRLGNIWFAHRTAWSVKQENRHSGVTKPRSGPWVEHWHVGRFKSGEKAIEDDANASLDPLKRFIPIIKEFVDRNDFPVHHADTNGRSFRFREGIEDAFTRGLRVHHEFAMMLGDFFYDGYSAKNWENAANYLRRE